MSAIYSKDLDTVIAQSVISSFQANVYLTFGYPTPWPNDLNPPQANTSVASYYETWKNMIGGKKISPYDASLAIPRFNWTANTTYIAYDDNQNSLTKDANTAYYVVTDDFNVYKCIANNYGQPSIY
jgi:hypothetical protein